MSINLILNLEIEPESFRPNFYSIMLKKIFTDIKRELNLACDEQRTGYEIQINLQNSPECKIKIKLIICEIIPL